jgi:hypothetical protein
MFLFNRLSGKPKFELPTTDIDLFGLLSPHECEDIVGIYLQESERAILFPSTCKTDTKDFEYILKRRDNRAYIAVQVKQGGERIHLDTPAYQSFDGDVFVFQTRNLYEGISTHNVHPLEPANMKSFCLEHLDLMPPYIQHWIEVWKTLTDKKGIKQGAQSA